MYELEVVRSWDRNPQVYSEVIGTSLAGQALFAYAPEAERARHQGQQVEVVLHPAVGDAQRGDGFELLGEHSLAGIHTQARRLELGRNALAVVRSNLGAIERTVDLIVKHLEGGELYVAPKRTV